MQSPEFGSSSSETSSSPSSTPLRSPNDGKGQSKITPVQKRLLQLKLELNKESNQRSTPLKSSRFVKVRPKQEQQQQQLDPQAVILRSIFPYLDFNSLKNARLACKKWETEAMYELVKRKFFIGLPKGFHSDFDSSEQQKIEASLRVFLSHYNFKVERVIIRHEKDIKILRGLKMLQSNNIKGLKLNFENFDELINKLKSFGNFPRLSSFVHLHPLKQYYLLRPPYPISMLQKFLNWDKKTSIRISPLVYQPTDFSGKEFLSIYEKFAEETCKIRLKTIIINLHWTFGNSENEKFHRQITNQLNKILWNNKDCLQELILFSPLEKLPGIEIPILSKVKTLISHVFFYKDPELSLDPFRRGRIFPVDFRFIEQLPNLNHVELKLRDRWPENCGFSLPFGLWNLSFKSAGIAPQVKTVNVFEGDYDLKSGMAAAFPNAQIFSNPDA